jgi:hypothetical protein
MAGFRAWHASVLMGALLMQYLRQQPAAAAFTNQVLNRCV